MCFKYLRASVLYRIQRGNVLCVPNNIHASWHIQHLYVTELCPSTFCICLFLFSDLVENFDEASKNEAN